VITNDVLSRSLRPGLCLGAAMTGILMLLGVSTCSPPGRGVSTGDSQTVTRNVGTTDPPGAPGVTSHLVLHTDTLLSGSSEPGVLVVDNNSGRPISAGCLRIEVQLVNAALPLELHPTPACLAANLAAGETRLPFTLKATQTVCSVPQGAVADAGDCQPLRPGTYRTQLLPGLNIPGPSPITVHVVAKT
jgi:hypothetical protein